MILTEKNLIDTLEKNPEVRMNGFLSELVNILKVIEPIKPYFIPSYNPENDCDKGLDATEQLMDIKDSIDMTNIDIYHRGCVCSNLYTHKRLNYILDYVLKFVELSNKLSNDFLPIDKETSLICNDLITNILGNVAIVLIEQFDLKTIKDGTELVNKDFYKYCDKIGEDYYKELTNKIYKIWEDNKVDLIVFEEYPELKDKFYDKFDMGIDPEYEEPFEWGLTYADVKSFLESPNADSLALYKKVMKVCDKNATN